MARHILHVLPIAAALVATPAHAAGPNELGLAIGEGAGFGVVYQRAVADRWRLRVDAGPTLTSGWSAGAGVLYELGNWGPRWYLVGSGLRKAVPQEIHLAGTVGLGMQAGPWFLEAGDTFFETRRDNGTGRERYRWGQVLSLSAGVLYAF